VPAHTSSMLWFLRVAIHAYISFVGCHAYRPENDEQQELQMIPLGTLVLLRDSKSQKAVGQALERSDSGLGFSALQQSATSESIVKSVNASQPAVNASDDPATATTPQPWDFNPACGKKVGKAEYNKGGDKLDSADQKGAKGVLARRKELKGKKCLGGGDNWFCLWKTKNGADTRSGNQCEVACKDCDNYHPKKPSVTCKEGKYDETPECIRNIQCDPGAGLKCMFGRRLGPYKSRGKVQH